MVKVVTPGKSGSHILFNALRGKVKLKSGDVSHDISPRGKQDEQMKTIFITADPRMVVRKIFEAKKKGPSWWFSTHLRHMGITPFYDWTISDYLEKGKDLLLLEARYNAWVHIPRDPMALLVLYKDLWKESTWEKISKYLGINISGNIPAYVERKLDPITPKNEARLNLMYSTLAENIEKDAKNA